MGRVRTIFNLHPDGRSLQVPASIVHGLMESLPRMEEDQLCYRTLGCTPIVLLVIYPPIKNRLIIFREYLFVKSAIFTMRSVGEDRQRQRPHYAHYYTSNFINPYVAALNGQQP